MELESEGKRSGRGDGSSVSRPTIAALGGIVLTALLSAGCGNADKGKVAGPAKLPEVVVERPTVKEVTDYEEFSGRTEAINMVEVRARVTGYLDKVHFKDGAEVKQGDLLFEIDPRTYNADLNKAAAQVEQTKAHLKRLEYDLERGKVLFDRKVITQEAADRLVYDRAETAANLDAANASRDTAALNVGFTKVTAPLSGRISRRSVDPGNLVRADETSLTTIVSLDPLYAYFDVDERTLLRIRRLEAEGKIKTTDGSGVCVLVGLADEEGFSLSGSIDFADNRVDPNTGTLRIRAVIANPKRVLAPGLFVRMRLPLGSPHRATLIAEEAIGSDQGQKYIYVLNDKDEAVYRRVKVGQLEEGLRVIESGVTANERVVVNGLQRVRPGAKVSPSFVSKPAAPAVSQAGSATKPVADPPEARISSQRGRVQVSVKR